MTKTQVRPHFLPANEDTTSDEGGSDDDAETSDSATKEEQQRRRNVRHIVVAMAVIGNACSRQFNRLQSMLGYLFYAYKAPRRLLGKCNHVGLTTSYKAVCGLLRSMANATVKELKTMVG